MQAGFLQPTSPPVPAPSRPTSSRRALTKALELAQEAVRIDATGEDPHGAVHAYARSVALLNEVMERVMRGEETDSKRRAPRRSAVAKEDEARRLRSIHDTYYDRMQILVMIYGIDPPHLPDYLPTSYNAPPELARQMSLDTLTMGNEVSAGTQNYQYEGDEAVEGIGSAMLTTSLSPIGTVDPRDEEYMSHVTPRAVHPTQLPSRTQGLPPMRQPPSGPPPTRPRMDSLGRRTASRPGPPGQPPAMAPPPLPGSAPFGSATYDLGSPAADNNRYQTHPLPRDLRNDMYSEEVGLLDDWDDLQDDRHAQFEEDEAIRRAYAPPKPRRQDTSDSAGSSNRSHQQRQNDTISNNAQYEERDYQDYYSAAHPFAQPETAPPSEEGHQESRPPTPGNRARGLTQSSTTSSRSGESSNPRTPPPVPTPPPLPQLVSTSTSQGTISQRRKPHPLSSLGGGGSSASLESHEHPPPLPRSHSPAIVESAPGAQAPSRMASQSRPGSSNSNLGMGGMAGRHRAASQPGRRPSQMGLHNNASTEYEPVPAIPPVPQTALPRKTSFTSANLAPPPLPSTRHESPALSGQGLPPMSASPIPPTPALPTGTASAFANTSGGLPAIPASVLPSPPPTDTLRRPYHLMNLLHSSIVTPTGGYITRKLHIPHDVWTQSGAKLNNMVEKGKCIAVLDQGLEDLSKVSNDFLRSVQVGVPARQGISRAMGERWVRALDDWLQVCDNVVANLGKKLGLGDGMSTKKTAGWGIKVKGTLDRMTNNKNLDSPASYVQNLANLFSASQMLDEHQRLLGSSQGLYAALPTDVRTQVEIRLKRSSEFFVTVVLDFVIRDLGQLLDKYAKKGERWMED